MATEFRVVPFIRDAGSRAAVGIPIRQLRLFRKSRGRWEPTPYSRIGEDGPGRACEKLAGDFLHYSVRDAAHHHRMIGERYAPLAAQQMFEEGRRTSALKIAIAAPSAFIRSFILKGGFRDGVAGTKHRQLRGPSCFSQAPDAVGETEEAVMRLESGQESESRRKRQIDV